MYADFWLNALHKTVRFPVMHWLEMLKLSSPSTCLSVVLNLDVNKKQNSAGIGEDLCLIVTILPKMDVGVSKSHVFLNYSPRALFSQWDMHLHGAAVGFLLLRGPTVGLPPVHSVWEL